MQEKAFNPAGGEYDQEDQNLAVSSGIKRATWTYFIFYHHIVRMILVRYQTDETRGVRGVWGKDEIVFDSY